MLSVSVLKVEVVKHRRSYALLTAAALPAMVLFVLLAMTLLRTRPISCAAVYGAGAGLWSTFLLPMGAVAITLLSAQLEHAGNAWRYLFTTPMSRMRHYTGKFTIDLLILALMSALAFMLIAFAVALARTVRPDVVTGPCSPLVSLAAIGRAWLAVFLLVVVQGWIALRFRSFLPAVVAGVLGALIIFLGSVSTFGRFTPWLAPVNAAAGDLVTTTVALVIGLGCGLLMLPLAVWSLSRIER
jgi:ABC-2 type transport system permease protein